MAQGKRALMNPLPVYLNPKPSPVLLITSAAEFPTDTTYQLQATGFSAITWLFVSVSNTSSDNTYINVNVQNNNKPTQTTSLNIRIMADTTLELPIPLPVPWGPFGTENVDLNLGVSTSVAGVYGTVWMMGQQ